jgi:indole-3-glycerol phosphate synthase
MMVEDILREIVENKKGEVARSKQKNPQAKLILQCNEYDRDVRNFKKAIKYEDGLALIAEIKFASPSAGKIVNGMGYLEIAKLYQESGAINALSMLTDAKYFGGKLTSITAVKDVVPVPVLRKDFIIDKYQIYESYLADADAILLIAAILDFSTMKKFLEISESLNMSCLVETHNSNEVKRAVEAGAEIIGINSRDLRTFRIDHTLFESLSKEIPDSLVKVAESGIESKIDSKKAYDSGANAILVGTSILKSGNPPQKIHELLSFN